MSLLKKAESEAQGGAAGANPFEEAAAGAATTTASAPSPAPAPSPAQVAANALAQHNATQGAVAAARPKVNIYAVKNLKDALPVDFNTLAQLQANQGKFRDKETEKVLGETIELQLLSWQDSWVVSPNDLKAPKELVKYGDNERTARDGTDMLEHLAMLKESGYPKAKIGHRCVIVGALLAAEKDQSLVGQLVQIDLSPQSRALFNRYIANSAYNLQIGKLTEETCMTLVLTAQDATGPDNTSYTRVSFEAKALRTA